jgi:competence protein ComEA
VRGRRQVSDGIAAARVRRLLVEPVSGWVPEPLPEEAGRAPDPRAEAPARRPAARSETSWAPRGQPGPAGDHDQPDEPDDLERLDDPHDRPPGPRERLLPETLRGGRLDPGHRGALALLLVCLLAAAGAAAVVLHGRPQEVLAPVRERAGDPLPGASGEPGAPAELVVSVAGAVVQPGVVRLPPGSRVDDAVRAAGGVQPGASVGLLNLARKLTDGEQVLVGVEPPPGAAPAAGSGGGKVDLNTATAADLEQLPGIGPVLAERIVAWRTEHGTFRSVDQLREVPGIGESKYLALEPEVVVP